MAEAHPVGFRWVMKAKEHGATIIHVDPRFSRTSALADIWVPIRAGGDIAFLGGLVQAHYREQSFLPRVRRSLHECLLHSARRFSRHRRRRDRRISPAGTRSNAPTTRKSWLYEGDDLSFPERDLTLQHPRCVFQTLRRHFARYTPEMVEKICGIPPELFHKVADALVARIRSGKNRGDLLCARLDATFKRRSDHSHRVDPATVAWQHRSARRRHPGAARSRVDPRFDRYSDALRYFARLSADAARRWHVKTTLRDYLDASDETDWSLA